MVAPALEASGICGKCGALTTADRMHKGWCLPCVAEWVDSTDPWLIYQAQSQLPPNVVPRTVMRQMEALETRVAEPIKDDDFLPLLQFMGHKGVGSQKSMWNFLKAMYTFELETSAEAFRLGVVCPNTVHLCGRHAPVQRSSILGFLSRIHSAGNDFKLFKADPHFRDFIRGFASDNRMRVFTYQRTNVDVFARAYSQWFKGKYGDSHFDKHSPAHWPFETEHDGKLREDGKLEELPDYVMEIGKLVSTIGTPATLREDLCQDLVVAVLTGEATVEELRIEAHMRRYVREAFRHHPLKYGRYSLDMLSTPSSFSDHKDQRAGIDDVTEEDVSPSRADRGWLGALCVDPDERRYGWHDGHERPIGLTTVAEVARHKQDGRAIDGPQVVRTAEDIDEEIREVFEAEQHPRWRRRLSD